jgi:hypothetical protein
MPALLVLAAGIVLLHGVFAAIVLARIISGGGIGDWVSIYSGASIVREGDGGHLFDPVAQEAMQRHLFGPDAVLNYLPLPGFVSVALSPLTVLSFRTTYLLWLAANLALAGGLLTTAHRGMRSATVPHASLLVVCMAVSLPLVDLLLLGQVDLWIVASFAGCLAALRRGQPGLAGAILSVALIKPHFAAGVVLLLLHQREWRALATFALGGLLLFALPMAVLGPGVLPDQVARIASFTRAGAEGQINVEMMANLRGCLASLTGLTDPLIWLGPTALLAAAGLLYSVPRLRQGSATSPGAWAVALLLPLLLTPHLHVHSLVLVLAALTLLAIHRVETGQRPFSPELALLGFILATALWLGALVGVNVLVILPLAAFALAMRSTAQSPAAGAVHGRNSEAPGEVAKRILNNSVETPKEAA